MKHVFLPVIAILCLARPTAVAAPAEARAADPRRDAVVEAIDQVLATVVNIRTETVREVSDPFDEWRRQFWGPYYRRRKETSYSLGSGVIVDDEGWILTNEHVVKRATSIFVRLSDGREFQADPVAESGTSDVALLQLRNPTKEKFKAIKFAAPDDLLLGETVIALGNPFGLGGSVSRGILSSRSRRPAVEGQALNFPDWLQTDAAINPGNSGGPLINLRGELIGISVAVLAEGQGIGFAIPIKRVNEALAAIYSPEEKAGLWFGARVTPGGLPLVIQSVQLESPAGKAGLRAGDAILRINGKTPETFVDFARELLAGGGKKDVRLTIRSRSGEKDVTIRMVPEASFFNNALIRKKTGFTVEPLSEEMTATVGLPADGGVVITEVEKGSPAAQAGLQRGMILTEIDGVDVHNPVKLARRLHQQREGDALTLNLIVPRTNGRFLHLLSRQATMKVR